MFFKKESEKKENKEKVTRKKVSNVKSLGIDLGTLNTVVAVPAGDKFEIYEIPSVVAVKKEDPSHVLAVGEEAKLMLGRTPEDIIAVRPLRRGVIESISQAKALLIHAVKKGSKNDVSSVERIVVGVPGDVSEVERKAVEEISKEIGIKNVITISEALAAAIGEGLPIADASGTMIIDLGAGSSDVAVISLGGITDIETFRYGGDNIDENLVRLVKEKYDVEIGLHEAEKCKIKVGMVKCNKELENKKIKIIGKCSKTNKPKEITVDSKMVAEAAEPLMKKLINALSDILERLSPELISGVYKRSVVVGGVSQIRGLKERIYEEVGIPVKISNDPLKVVAKGAAIVAAEPRALEPEIRLKAMK
ncbi:rod shape-determining protein MreB [Methanothermus fervidus DSM 2088]|uniref:Cell shape-determining protein MreB n=1 Tax=Methanothermus fervidus (strain ATCC 43054 / DSM 2088 / JCM 10308 / V24 S) TaxID=523846 RepID=E3GZI2_METFV|nr:rod shape-determining protein [Methanothermus fervidus]ADP77714.1 rod shape-determining protein MreB [Methanothermus fervidus DSM 2088]